MSSFKPLVLPAVGLLVVGGYWIWSSSAPAPTTATSTGDSKAKAPASTGAKSSGNSNAGGPEAKTGSPSTTKTGSTPAPDRASRRDRAATNAMREQLRAAARARSGGSGNAGGAAPSAEPKLDATYIGARVREDLLPIAQECYETALQTQPKLAGKVVMKFSIVGDPSVGGVVDEATEDPSSEIKDPDLLECMRESMLSLSFPPPEDGGKVDVTYPFVFSPDAPDE